MQMIRRQLYLTETQVETMKFLAEQDGVKISEIIRRALDFYLGYRLYVNNLQSQDNSRKGNERNSQ
jgi:hypothetical protein